MKYILEGNPKEVAKVIQENRIRVERGQISFALVPDEEVNPEAADTKDVIDEDTKDVIDEDTKDVIDEDTKDVIDEDTKDVDAVDSKDVDAADTKDAPTKTAKRTKKSE